MTDEAKLGISHFLRAQPIRVCSSMASMGRRPRFRWSVGFGIASDGETEVQDKDDELCLTSSFNRPPCSSLHLTLENARSKVLSATTDESEQLYTEPYCEPMRSLNMDEGHER